MPLKKPALQTMRSCQRKSDTGPNFKQIMDNYERMSGFGCNICEIGNGNLDKDEDSKMAANAFCN